MGKASEEVKTVDIAQAVVNTKCSKRIEGQQGVSMWRGRNVGDDRKGHH